MKKKTIPVEFVEINLHGHKIQIFSNKVKIYNHERIPLFDFKSIVNLKVEYLMMEGFVPRSKNVKIEIVTPAEMVDSKVETPT